MSIRRATVAIVAIATLLVMATLVPAGRGGGVVIAQTPVAFFGTPPGPGQIGLLITSRETTPTELAT